jgi:hypothetical protein
VILADPVNDMTVAMIAVDTVGSSIVKGLLFIFNILNEIDVHVLIVFTFTKTAKLVVRCRQALAVQEFVQLVYYIFTAVIRKSEESFSKL